ncbi:hypothetical protein OSB04_032130 [Centaurea solstitialis]|uniref:Uncharacterized protein n=1 Tax=Centaurea solstitialis TaxID=347529 RepID=A0AA38SUF2_9ASTR|nr:hypothetical protein OSB04_032130 [Centaurea solstitialis]
MGQQSLIYSFVSRGSVILAEYTEFTGNFTSIASNAYRSFLQLTTSLLTIAMDIPSITLLKMASVYFIDEKTVNIEQSYEDSIPWSEGIGEDIWFINVWCEHFPDQLLELLEIINHSVSMSAYCVVAAESAGRQVPMAFLERTKDDFTKKYAGGGKAATATANSLNKEFGPKLKEQMQYCVDHPEEISKLSKVKAQVSEVKGVMMENIEKVLDRGEKIELLVDKTENLRSQAQDFRTQGTQMRRKMWLQNMKIKLIVLGIIIALILIIVLSVCGGFNCGK